MHYDAYAFTSNAQPTLQPLNATIPLTRIGQRSTLSEQDIRHIEALYCEGVYVCSEMCGPWVYKQTKTFTL